MISITVAVETATVNLHARSADNGRTSISRNTLLLQQFAQRKHFSLCQAVYAVYTSWNPTRCIMCVNKLKHQARRRQTNLKLKLVFTAPSSISICTQHFEATKQPQLQAKGTKRYLSHSSGVLHTRQNLPIHLEIMCSAALHQASVSQHPGPFGSLSVWFSSSQGHLSINRRQSSYNDEERIGPLLVSSSAEP